MRRRRPWPASRSRSRAGAWSPFAQADRFNARTADFSLAFDGEMTRYREMSMFILPGATAMLEARGEVSREYELSAKDGLLAREGLRKWSWRAPLDVGMYDLRLEGPGAGGGRDRITLHAFVMERASEVKGGFLHGYRIGDYPAAPHKGNAIYRPPPGFIEVTKDNEDTRLTPHFRLGQFVCKQEPVGQYPKYVVLEERLLLQLEAILQLVNTLGSDVDTLHVMSGYRTPSYNRALGDAQYSMHQWGGAADIFVDEDDKFRMDDLNRDGRIDTEDARYLAGISTRCSRPRRTADSRGASACTAPPRRIRRSCTLTCAARNQSSSSCFRVFVVAKGPREQWGC